MLTAAFMGGFVWTFADRKSSSPTKLVTVGVVTAAMGFLFLMACNSKADEFKHVQLTGLRNRRGAHALKFVADTYRTAMDPSAGFSMSLLCLTFGVSLFQELIKTIPLTMRLAAKNSNRVPWIEALTLGLASGIGFGVVEGVMYSSQF